MKITNVLNPDLVYKLMRFQPSLHNKIAQALKILHRTSYLAKEPKPTTINHTVAKAAFERHQLSD